MTDNDATAARLPGTYDECVERVRAVVREKSDVVLEVLGRYPHPDTIGALAVEFTEWPLGGEAEQLSGLLASTVGRADLWDRDVLADLARHEEMEDTCPLCHVVWVVATNALKQEALDEMAQVCAENGIPLVKGPHGAGYEVEGWQEHAVQTACGPGR